MAVFLKTKYTDRQRLTAADLQNQQSYDSGKRMLINRLAFGSGVVCGLEVKINGQRDGFSIGAGLAFDASGQELYLPEQRQLSCQDCLKEGVNKKESWYICLFLEEKECGTGYILEDNGVQTAASNRIEESVRLSICQEAGGVALARFTVRQKKDGALEIGKLHILQSEAKKHTTTGSLVLRCGLSDNQTIFSREIVHGLGLGPVQVTLSCEDWTESAESYLSGDTELFQSGLRLAARLFPGKGTFVAAVKVGENPPSNGLIKLRWFASRAEETAEIPPDPPKPPKPEEKQYRLEPRVAMLHPGASTQFCLYGMDGLPCEQKPLFSVEEGGGRINAEGYYLAPEKTGFYTVQASLPGAVRTYSAIAAVLRNT